MEFFKKSPFFCENSLLYEAEFILRSNSKIVSKETVKFNLENQSSLLWLYVLVKLYEPIVDDISYEIVSPTNSIRFGYTLGAIHRQMRVKTSYKLPPVDYFPYTFGSVIRIYPNGKTDKSDYADFFSFYNITPQEPLITALKLYESLFGKICIPDYLPDEPTEMDINKMDKRECVKDSTPFILRVNSFSRKYFTCLDDELDQEISLDKIIDSLRNL